jgi:hypothetical protein
VFVDIKVNEVSELNDWNLNSEWEFCVKNEEERVMRVNLPDIS